jgi:hypothetical protein
MHGNAFGMVDWESVQFTKGVGSSLTQDSFLKFHFIRYLIIFFDKRYLINLSNIQKATK